jgi:hypothetical protein
MKSNYLSFRQRRILIASDLDWLPEQISDELKRTHSEIGAMVLSAINLKGSECKVAISVMEIRDEIDNKYDVWLTTRQICQTLYRLCKKKWVEHCTRGYYRLPQEFSKLIRKEAAESTFSLSPTD